MLWTQKTLNTFVIFKICSFPINICSYEQLEDNVPLIPDLEMLSRWKR